MSVRVGPTWRGEKGKWLVTIYFRHRDGSTCRDRTVVPNVDTPHIASESQAKKWGEQREKDLYVAGPPKPVETAATENVSVWYGRYYDAAALGQVGKKNRGRPQEGAEKRRQIFRLWIEPEIGALDMSAVTSKHLRRVVAKLDDAISERLAYYESGSDEGIKPGISGKHASNIWSEITNPFREACNSKREELRVLDGLTNPAYGVEGPRTTEEREQEALFPAEVLSLLGCEDLPLARRRLYAVSIYTGMRRSELARLRAEDIDLAHQTIMVRGKKTDAASRTIPIEPALLPLVRILVRESDNGAKIRKRTTQDEGVLLSVPRGDGSGGASDLLTDDMHIARLNRKALWTDDAHHMPFSFHGLRHTAITHWAVAGHELLWLLTVAGHTDVTMTRRYLAQASSVSKRFGTPHAKLPASLIRGILAHALPTAHRHLRSA